MSSESSVSVAEILRLRSTNKIDEQTALDIINLEIQKEISKQQTCKLEILHKSIELLKLASAVDVPPSLIPLLFDNELDSVRSALETGAGQDAGPQPKPKPKPGALLAHKRTHSMPVAGPGNAPGPGSDPSWAASPSRAASVNNYSNYYQLSGGQKSMMGTLTSLQFIKESPGDLKRR